MKTKVEFVNRVVRQGNSLCVRIPATIKKELNLEEGKEVMISLVPSEQLYEYDEKTIKHLLDIAMKIKKLRKYSKIKQRFFILLNLEFLEKTLSKDTKKQKKRQIKFIEEKKKEFGSRLIDEFIDWGTTFNKEAFITEKDGTVILKSKYR